MGRLVSLKERPVLYEDIGKSIFDRDGVELIIEGFVSGKTRGHSKEWSVNYQDGFCVYHPEQYYWSRPAIVDEEEYQALQADNAKLIDTNYELLKDQLKIKDENKKMKELVERAGTFIKQAQTD